MQNQIDYINAHNGGIQCCSDAGGLVGWSNTAEGIAYILNTKGIAPVVMGSSSMDFASEYGFEDDEGAQWLWKKALELV